MLRSVASEGQGYHRTMDPFHGQYSKGTSRVLVHICMYTLVHFAGSGRLTLTFVVVKGVDVRKISLQ